MAAITEEQNREPRRLNPPKVFLSYAHEDSDVASRVADVLSAQGIDVWTDQKIAVGEPIVSAIATSIEKCDVILVLMSPSSAKSQVAAAEVALGVAGSLGKARKRVIPVLIGGDERDSVPPLLVNRRFIDLRGETENRLELGRLAYEVLDPPPSTSPAFESGIRLTRLETDALRKRVAIEVAEEYAVQKTAVRWFFRGTLVVLSVILVALNVVLLLNDVNEAAYLLTSLNVGVSILSVATLQNSKRAIDDAKWLHR